MAIHNRAGQPAQQSDLINVAQLTAQYYVLKPEAGNAEHAVKFGTSGHRGSAARHSFNEPHILAIAQAIAEERAKNGITGPCYVGKDTHALSEPAFISVLEVLAANGVDVIVPREGRQMADGEHSRQGHSRRTPRDQEMGARTIQQSVRETGRAQMLSKHQP